MTSSKKVIGGTIDEPTDDLVHLKELIGAEKIKLVIDKRILLEKTVEAHIYVETRECNNN